MKALVDMNLSPTWASFLKGEGIEAVHWAAIGDPRAQDRELMAWARQGGYIVFTHDLDFSILIARPAPAVRASCRFEPWILSPAR